MVGKKGKCLYCEKLSEDLAAHLSAYHISTGDTAYLFQDLMIQVEQMQNQITSLQNKVYAVHGE
jgi:hypothetical protein